MTVFILDQTSLYQGEEYIASLIPDESTMFDGNLYQAWNFRSKANNSLQVKCFYHQIKAPLLKSIPNFTHVCWLGDKAFLENLFVNKQFPLNFGSDCKLDLAAISKVDQEVQYSDAA